MSDLPTAPVPCETCHAPAGSPCVFTTGPNAGKPRGPRYGLHDERKEDAGWYNLGASSRQSEVDEAVTAREAAEAGLRDLEAEVQETYAEHQAKIDQLDRALRNTEVKLDQTYSELADARAETVTVTTERDAARKVYADHMRDAHSTTPTTPRAPGAPPLGSVTYDIPSGHTPVNVAPGGIKAAIAATTSTKVVLVAAAGTYRDTFSTPADKDIIIQPAPGAVVWFDGGGTLKRQVTASGRLLFRGIGVRNHVPPFGTENGGNAENSENVAIYLGGKTPGSGFEDCHLTASTGNVAKIITPKATVRRCTFEDIGHTPLYLTGHDSVIEDVIVRRFNLNGHPPEPQSAAIKVTGTRGLRVRNVQLEDGNGAHGLWLDDTCWDAQFVKVRVNGAGVDGRKRMKDGGISEMSEDVLLVDYKVTGCETAYTALDSGNIRAWGCDFRGNAVGFKGYQDRRTNTLERLAPKTVVPMVTRALTFGNCDFDGPMPIVLYPMSTATGPGQVAGEDMVDRIAGCTFKDQGPELGPVGGGNRKAHDTEAALRATLGNKVGPVQYGGDPAKAERVTVPAEVAALL